MLEIILILTIVSCLLFVIFALAAYARKLQLRIFELEKGLRDAAIAFLTMQSGIIELKKEFEQKVQDNAQKLH